MNGLGLRVCIFTSTRYFELGDLDSGVTRTVIYSSSSLGRMVTLCIYNEHQSLTITKVQFIGKHSDIQLVRV
jgi:hypothetical protein